MAREIQVKEHTGNIVTVGYNFEYKYYYITNKGYTTKRNTPKLAKEVIDVIASDYSTSLPTEEQIQALSTTYEGLQNLYYTWSDTGSYIATIQINTYKEHPLTLNAEKGKLYIMNSNIIFDLSLNEDYRGRVEAIRLYYYDILGVDLSYRFYKALYDLITSYYSPKVYNNITLTNNNSLMYSNTFSMSNFSNISPVSYTCITNPNDTYTLEKLADVISLENKVITLPTAVPSTINIGDTLNISNAVTEVENTPYSANGNYTITAIEDNTITVDENFPTPFYYNPPTLNIRGYETNISTINRATNEITLTTNVPDGLLVGDIITVYGTTITTSIGEELTVDGEYTISSIGLNADGTTNTKVIIVEEQPNTNYTYSSGTHPVVYKEIKVADIDKITGTSINLTNTPSLPLTNGTKTVIIYTEGTKSMTTVQAYNSETKVVTTTSTLPSTEAQYGTLNRLVPDTEVLINTLSSTFPNYMPEGEVMVDEYTECTDYIALSRPAFTGINAEANFQKILPTEDIYDNLNSPVPNEYNITWTEKESSESITIAMQLVGMYSTIYKE